MYSISVSFLSSIVFSFLLCYYCSVCFLQLSSFFLSYFLYSFPFLSFWLLSLPSLYSLSVFPLLFLFFLHFYFLSLHFASHYFSSTSLPFSLIIYFSIFSETNQLHFPLSGERNETKRYNHECKRTYSRFMKTFAFLFTMREQANRQT